MATLNRRDFLKAVGISSTAAAAACSYDPRTPPEKILPYVTQAEDELPGSSTYYSTLCTECASACGAVARNRDGRVVFVEGNPDHPNGPGLCTRGHMSLMATYSPDRLDGPMLAGKPIAWADAHAKIVEAIKGAGGKKVAWLGRYRTGSVAKLLGQLEKGVSLERVHWEPLGVETLRAATKAVFGKDTLPTFDLSGAHTIVTFGMDFLGTAFDSMQMVKGWAKAKDPRSKDAQQNAFVTRLVAIEPRVGLSTSQADHWLAPAPGTESQVALALAKICTEKKGYTGPASGMLAGVDIAKVAELSGLTAEKLEQVAGWLAAGPSVVLPGGFGNHGTDGTTLAIAAFVLNEVLGNIGQSVVFGREHDLGVVSSYRDVRALIDAARKGEIGVLFLDGVNPAYNLPAEDQAFDALKNVGLLVQFANEPDDSSTEGALVLPTGTSLEGWGDAEVTAGIHVLQQPAMLPIRDSQGVGDILLKLGKELAPASAAAAPAPAPVAAPAVADAAAPADAAAAPAPAPVVAPVAAPTVGSLGFDFDSFGAFVKARWEKEVFPKASGYANFEAFWVEVRQKGGFFQVATPSGAPFQLSVLPALSNGLEGTSFALLVYPSPILGDGRHANVPWAQELPDPISTMSWGTWAELHPKTVEKLGLNEQDWVEVKTPAGSFKVSFFASKGVREDTVAVHLGNGHSASMGRYAKGKGENPMKLLGSKIDEASGALAVYTTRAELSRAGSGSGAFFAVGNIDQDGRSLANTVAADAAVANVTGQPGSIVPIHHIPVDERLTERNLTDMFPEPQHPTYRLAISFDTNACNGCMACVIACNLENNIPFVGPSQQERGRTMNWIRMNRFWEGDGESPDIRYLPAICQQCAHAPCEGVCPVLATYHNLDGLNAMVYNRCVGTRYCANNCPYAARRFNYHTWKWPETFQLMLNPDLMAREMGVMEKCTFCVQRVRSVKDSWRDLKQEVPDSAFQKLTACASACPTEAILFGNAKDENSRVRKEGWDTPRSYTLLGELNTKPGVRYLASVKHGFKPKAIHGAGHGAGHGGEHGGEHGAGHGGGEHGAEKEGAHGAGDGAGHEDQKGGHGADGAHKEG